MANTIKANDFRNYVGPYGTGLGPWTVDILRAVVEVVGDAQVLVETDSRTGHTLLGTIAGVKDRTIDSQYPHIGITTMYDGGQEQTIWYRTDNMGSHIVVLDNSRSTFRVLDLLRKAAAAA